MDAFFGQFGAAVFHHVLRLHGKTADDLSGALVLAQLLEYILRALEGDGQVAILLFDFIVAVVGRGVVGHGSGLENKVGLPGPGGHLPIQVGGGHDGHGVHKGRRLQRGGAGDQGHLRAPPRGHTGQRIAHFARGVVGEVAHRVQGFLRRTGGDQHPFAGKVVGQGDGVEDMLQQQLRLGQLACPHCAAGQPSAGRVDDLPAVSAQKVQIVLGHLIFVHIGVHGRGDELGAAAGQHRGGQHIVRNAVGQFGAHIGGGRGDDDQVGPVGHGDVLHLMDEVAVKGVGQALVARQLLKGERSDELGGVLGHDDLHMGVLLDQRGGKIGSLVRGDAAGDAQQDGFSLQHS